MSLIPGNPMTATNPTRVEPSLYLSRELSWLEFNRRVLHEATDPRTPLLEALKFLAIFSANLDEFFMVRVAGLKQQIEAEVSRCTPDGRTPTEHLQAIHQALSPLAQHQHHTFDQHLRPQMAQKGIHLLPYNALEAQQVAYLQTYFEEQIFPVLTPLAVDPGHPFPYISNLSLNLAVVVEDPQADEHHFARVKVPRVLPRFVSLPADLWPSQVQPCHWVGVALEEVIGANVHHLFPGMVVQGHCVFRITRNADLAVEEDEADDLMLAIEQELRKRRLGGSAVRMELQSTAPVAVRQLLMQEMDLGEVDVYPVDGLLGLGDLTTFLALPLPALKDRPWTPVVPPAFRALSRPQVDEAAPDLESAEDLFALLRRGDQLVHHPYHSFSATVQRFITQAAHDPQVLAIKMTLYRTSGDSPIVNALISAAENGKQVSVLVELKARFDEENNIQWARKLERSGVHVVYGLMGLKTHTKVTLVVRQEGEHMRRYFHVGTGNYNPKTAKFYTDLGLLSARPDLGADLTDLFNYLTGYSRQDHYRQLLVAPLTLRPRFNQLIEAEIAQAKQGKPARIVAKMNALVDPDMIQRLYGASQAGVAIDLIVRGICCLRPGVKGLSDTIRVVSIVGRFLEHSRIFYFHHGGNEIMLMGSADWMPRNLDRRVEAVVPILDETIRQHLHQVLTLSLDDNRQAWDMQPDGTYRQRRADTPAAEISSQVQLMRQAEAAGEA